MNILLLLIPAALFLGGLGLAGFIWAMRSGQFDDMEGAAMRILIEDDDDVAGPGQTAEQSSAAGHGKRRDQD